jgi:hypothetical protein
MSKTHPRRVLRALAFCICLPSAFPLLAADSIATENAKPGTDSWQLTNPASMFGSESTNASDYAVAEIQGYASKTSVNHGDSIDFFVRTINTNPYTVSVYRIGWYGGLGSRLMLGPVTLQGVVQPMPPAPVFWPSGDGLVECNWSASYRLNVPTDWVSGVYLAKLALSSPAKESYIIFVVRDDASSAPILVQASLGTYQAYNEWGGSSLYTLLNGSPTGYRVSFNRPFWRAFGAGNFFGPLGSPHYEIHLVRWLESQGYDATYVTDLDAHENPNLLLSKKVWVDLAHDEYWSWQMRDTVERGRDAGVHLAFLGANACYWQVRFEPSSTGDPDRTMIGYKTLAANDHPADPRFVTTLWRNIRPEAALVGIEYNGVSQVIDSDVVITNPSHWMFNGTGLVDGSILPNVLGYETDSVTAETPPGTITLAHSPFPKGSPQVNADMTIYTAPSAAYVWATGSLQWSAGLDDYVPSRGVVPAAQRITANFLNRALQGPADNPPPPPPSVGRLAATVTASSEAPGYPASSAGDGNTTTQWVASLNPDRANNNAWIQLDFGSRREVQNLKWLGASFTPYPAWSPVDYSIQISDDGNTWQTLFTRTNTNAVTTGIEVFNAQARFLRMVTTKVGDGSGWSLSFFEFWAEGPTVVPAPTLLSLSLSPTSVTGASNSTGTVTLSAAAPAGGAAVSLSSNNAAASVPASVTVPEGATSATFTVTSSAVSASTTVTISAAYGSGAPQTASLMVLPPTVLSLDLSPTSVTGATSSTGTVTLNSPAPAGGAAVSLSSNAAVASVPGTVTVPQGGTTAAFTVTTSPVATATTVIITASYTGSQTASLTVMPPVVSSVAVSPTRVTGGASSSGTLNLNGPAPANGAVVSLSSSNAAVAAVPSSGTVTVAAGATTASFTVTTKAVANSTTVSITASYGGGAPQTASLTVIPPVLVSLTLNPSTVTGGNSSVGTVTLNGAAPPGGAAVSLSSSDTSVATVPSSVTIPAGSTSATFTVNTSTVVFSTSATISASWRGVTKRAVLNVNSLVPIIL